MKKPTALPRSFLFGLLLLSTLTVVHAAARTIPAAQDKDAATADKRGDKTADEAAQKKAAAPRAKKDTAQQKSSANSSKAVPRPDKFLALTGARVMTQTQQGTLKSATVLLNNDVITAIGPDVKIPDGAQTIDVTGLTIAPGLIDVRSTLWLTSRSAGQSSTNGSMDALDGVDPYSDDWIEVVAQGVTAVYIQPSGTLGGPGHVLQAAPAESQSAKDLVIQEHAGIRASLGLTARSSNDRYKQYTSLKSALAGLKKYQAEWKKYEEALKKYEEAKKKQASGAKPTEKKTEPQKKPTTTGSTIRTRSGTRQLPPGFRIVVGPDGRRRIVRGPPPSGSTPPADKKDDEKKEEQKKDEKAKTDSKSGDDKSKSTTAKKTEELKEPKKPKRDRTKDVLVKLLTKDTPLRLELHRADDAVYAKKLAEEFSIDIVFDGVSQLNDGWDEVREAMTPLVVGPVLAVESLPSSMSGRRSNWLQPINDSDNQLALGTFTKHPRGSRLLRATAAAAVAQGMDRDRAFAAITSSAAKTVGAADKIGSLQKGMRADLAVYAGDPLDPGTPVRMTIVGGRIVHDNATAVAAQDTIFSEPSSLPKKFPAEYAIRSQQVLMPDGSLQPAAIKVSAGRIESVGDETHDDLPVYDVGDAVVTPGLVAGQLNLSNTNSRLADMAWTSAADSFDPASQTLRRLVRKGFTSFLLSPSAFSVLAGQLGCVRIGADEELAADSPGSLFVLASASRSSARFPATLSGQVQLVDGFLQDEPPETDLYVPTEVLAAINAQRKQLAAAVRSGEQIAVIQAETAAEIRAALQLIARHQLKANLYRANEIVPFLDQIKDLKVGLIARPFSIADYDWFAADLAAASAAGIPIAFGGGSADQLRMTAALAVNAGMSPAAALRALTSDAAGMCGLKHSGQLRPDAPADLVIWNGSPLDLRARPLRVIVDGRIVEEES